MALMVRSMRKRIPEEDVSRRPLATREQLASRLSGRRTKPAVKTQMKIQKGTADGSDRLTQIFYVAAQLFCEQGYDATSMSDISDAIGVTKAAIYHFIPGGKKDLLFAIINYGMDTVLESVITPAREFKDPEQRLRAIITNHAKLVMSGSTEGGINPVTVIVDEVASLSPPQRKKVDQRKRSYMDFVTETLREMKAQGKLKDIDVTVVGFSLIGTIIWLGHWYRPDGRLSSDEVAETMCTMILNGILAD
jgi:TetR/AcrR family transcriptional regulator, cholesterol catabolism regulator